MGDEGLVMIKSKNGLMIPVGFALTMLVVGGGAVYSWAQQGQKIEDLESRMAKQEAIQKQVHKLAVNQGQLTEQIKAQVILQKERYETLYGMLNSVAARFDVGP